MASYNVAIRPAAGKDIERIDQRTLRQRIIDRITKLANNPRPPGCEKLSGTTNTYRIRQGDYRIIYDIEDTRVLVVVVKVAHRKDVYRRRGRA